MTRKVPEEHQLLKHKSGGAETLTYINLRVSEAPFYDLSNKFFGCLTYRVVRKGYSRRKKLRTMGNRASALRASRIVRSRWNDRYPRCYR